MFSLMFQKLLHKKWMVICLLIGNILLISVAVSHPMYRTSSFQRMLTDEFDASYEKRGVWPAINTVTYRKAGKNTGLDPEKIQEYVDNSKDAFGVSTLYDIFFVTTVEYKVEPFVERDSDVSHSLKVAYMSGIEDHISLVSGRMPVDGITEDGFIEVIISQTTEQTQDLLLDEELQTVKYYDINGDTIKIRVVGIFKKDNPDDPYWADNTLTLNKEGFVSEETFRSIFMASEETLQYYAFVYNWYSVWDYETIKPQDVKALVNTTASVKAIEPYGRLVQSNSYESILESYSAKARKVEAALLILQVPAMLLLCAFLYMISGQMVEMEQSEISLMKSRGAKRGQIIRLYLFQSIFLGLISLVAAIPLGRVLCSVLGSASNFLEFETTRKLDVYFSTDIILYAGGALFVGILMTVIPVIGYSKLGIVNLKQGKHRRKRSFWKVSFIDVLCLAVSLYGYYNYNHNKSSITQAVLSGESLDPMVYFSSSLFILGAGLLLLRLQPLLVKLVFSVRKKRLKPATYASFLETIRSGKKQEFIMIFMIMTVALGIFNATVARTIVSNAEDNAEYINGADVVVKEKWSDNSAVLAMDPTAEFKYYEPDFNKYGTIEGLEVVTKVVNTTATVSFSGSKVSSSIMAIVPSEFAKVVTLDDSLNYYDIYDYLNVLASVENAALVSEDFMTEQGLSLGDTLQFSDSHFGDISVKIYGFFSYWPTYEPTGYTLNRMGDAVESENYMVVCNLAYMQNEWAVTPYEVWMKTDDTSGLYEYIEGRPSLTFTKFNDLELIKDDIKEDTLFQGTNGILTMSFIIVLLLCAVGYLIYWIMSIRSRELLFGVLRAMGMRKGEITAMLIVEQICCGLYSILAGTLVGFLAANLYVPLVQGAYAADNQVLPLTLVSYPSDMVRLFGVILVVILVCLVIIGRIVSHMNISNALKLGED